MARKNRTTLRRLSPVAREVAAIANDLDKLNRRLLRLAAKLDDDVAVASKRVTKHGLAIKPRPCINCGGIYTPEEVGVWHCEATECQEAKRQKEAAHGTSHRT